MGQASADRTATRTQQACPLSQAAPEAALAASAAAGASRLLLPILVPDLVAKPVRSLKRVMRMAPPPAALGKESTPQAPSPLTTPFIEATFRAPAVPTQLMQQRGQAAHRSMSATPPTVRLPLAVAAWQLVHILRKVPRRRTLVTAAALPSPFQLSATSPTRGEFSRLAPAPPTLASMQRCPRSPLPCRWTPQRKLFRRSPLQLLAPTARMPSSTHPHWSLTVWAGRSALHAAHDGRRRPLCRRR
mmetsp:Transcript_116053/g.333299  ORF Transcript_116053/g.333299 Transcript_116053/m.333299 type:complete len:245 (+) Transcript_116053:126-860(+)